MSLRHALLPLLLFSLSVSFATAQTIRVDVPDLTGLSPGSSVEIPIRLASSLEAGDEVISYSLNIVYDTNILTIDGISETGTLTEGWTTGDGGIGLTNGQVIINKVKPDVGSPLVTGPGVIVYLTGSLLSTGSTDLQFESTADIPGGFQFGDDNVVTATSGNLSAGNDLVFTEVHADPATQNDDGDANNDGVVNGGDEFVEIVNTGLTAIDLGGYQLVQPIGEDDTVLFTFPAVSLEPGVAAVVFGDGTPVNIPGLVFTSGDLDLADDGQTVALLDDSGTRIDAVTYGPEADEGQSVTRSPDFTDAFILHTQAPSSALYSPGENPSGDPLPVEFGSFDAVRDGRDVVLQWTTLTETNNSGFGVEQEVDGRFEEIRFVPGAGTTTEQRSYRVRLPDPGPGTHTYRLRQVDTDGSTRLSQVRRVTVPLQTAARVVIVGSNPFRADTALELRVRRTQSVTAALYNVLGQRVRILHDGTVPAGEPVRLRVDGDGLPSGLYFYRIVGADVRQSGQLVHIK
jgi:hypothetical protein